MYRFLTLLSLLVLTTRFADAQPDAPETTAPVLPQPKHDLTTPENAVRSFVAAFILNDAERALACVYRANKRNRSGLLRRMERRKDNKEAYTLTLVKMELDKVPNLATALVEYQYERAGGMREPLIFVQASERLSLFRDGDSWKVLAGNPAYHGTPAQGGSLQSLATEIAHPEVREPPARCVRQISSLTQLMTSLLVDKNNGKISVGQKAAEAKIDAATKAKQSLLKQALVSELKGNYGPNPSWLFRCPADGDDNEKESYSFNLKLDGVLVKDIVEPENVILVYEGKDEKFDFRHDGRASVAFADGHVELLNAEQVKTLRWTSEK